MLDRPLRVGLIGAGWVSQHHLLGWRALAGRAQVVAIADPAHENARRRAEAFGAPHSYRTAREMVASESLDAVDIATPREFHVEMVRLAAERGLAALCQKPLAPTLAEAEALAGETNGRIRLMVHENWRFRPYYRQARRWIVDGAIGAVRQCDFALLSSGLIPDAAGRRPALERQPFMRSLARMLVMEVLIHHIDTVRFLLGPLEVKAAALGRACPELIGEDAATIMMATREGASAVIVSNMSAHGFAPGLADRMTILGDRGTITLEDGALALTGAKRESVGYDVAAAYQDAYNAAIAHFVDCLSTGAPFETSPADNLETLRLVEAVYAMNGG